MEREMAGSGGLKGLAKGLSEAAFRKRCGAPRSSAPCCSAIAASRGRR
jgi:hypothetical protein